MSSCLFLIQTLKLNQMQYQEMCKSTDKKENKFLETNLQMWWKNNMKSAYQFVKKSLRNSFLTQKMPTKIGW